MSIKEILKQNSLIRKLGKKINNIKKYKYEEHEFSKYSMDSAERKKDYRYSLLMLVHSIEKGLCMPNLRPFGFKKVIKIKDYLMCIDNKEMFEYKLGVSILFEWCNAFEQNGWEKTNEYLEIKEFLKGKEKTFDCGRKKYIPLMQKRDTFKDVVLSRHSVRDFQKKKIKVEDINDAINCFIATPTACNRQMCRLIKVENEIISEELNRMILGIHGLNKDNINYFIVTYDIASLSYSGEAQQGMFNAGLCTTNFINALHSLSIGSCCLQWSNKKSEDLKMRELLNLNKSERIAIVIGAGYYLDENIIPCSVRKDINDIFSII